MQKFTLTHFPEGASGQIAGLGAQVAPKIKVSEEIGTGIQKTRMSLIGGFLVF